MIAYPPLTEWVHVHSFDITASGRPRTRPILVEARWYKIGSSATLIGFIPAAQKPLGALCHRDKRLIGQRLREWWSAGIGR
jgi:hypothetical protein